MNTNPLQALLGIIGKLSPKQKFMLGGGVLLTVALMAVLMFFLNEPNYTTLYSGLAQEDAAKVVDYLNAQKIPFRLDDNGQSIKVPREKVYETRLSLAGKGIPSSGIIGYEIFDKSTMGMSDFMQKLNYKRALEGEIARTIDEQDGVDGARVHLVIPQKSLFREEEKLPSASVVLKLHNNKVLTKENILSIVNLLCGSVEGLVPNKVSVIDTKGRILNTENEEGPMAFASTKQYEVKQSVENYLAQKAQKILDNVLGFGNSMVQVNADLNFDQVEKTMEQYDPDSQVAISEQTVKNNNQGSAAGDTSNQSNENVLTNYEINKTIQKVIEGSGNILRLSVAAVVNDTQKEVKKGDKAEMVNEPRTPEQMKKLEEIVRNAVGISDERHDQFSLVNIPFEPKLSDEVFDTPTTGPLPAPDQWVNIIFILVAIVASIVILKSLMKKLKNERIVIGTYNPGGLATADAGSMPAPRLSGGSGGGGGGLQAQRQMPSSKKRPLLPIGDIEDDISEEALMKKNQQDRIINYVSKNPVDAAKLINAWMHEDEI